LATGVPIASDFYARDPPRPPHPAPTRRSSDLPTDAADVGPADDHPRGGVQMKRYFFIADSLDDLEIVERNLESGGVLDPQIHVLDRKSTRLNSSHVKISYAVFCLKKKKRGHSI